MFHNLLYFHGISETRDNEYRVETIEPARTHGPTPSERTRGVARPRGASRFIDSLDEAAQPREAHESETANAASNAGRRGVRNDSR